MNPFFWLLLLLACVILWFLLRVGFVMVGTAIFNLLEDTKTILESNGDEEDETEETKYE